MRRFKPHLEILPPAQLHLWSRLKPLVDMGFVLYGGTAVALRCGHRISVDFDFFTDRALSQPALVSKLPFLSTATTLQSQPQTFTVMLEAPDAPGSVKLSFFGSIGFGRVGEPDLTDDGVLLIASPDDLLATKLKVILQRAEAKDYRDVAALLKTGTSVERGLSAARLFYGPTFQPSESLKALVYFGDGDLHTLAEADRNALVQAVRSVGDLPNIELVATELGLAREKVAHQGPRKH